MYCRCCHSFSDLMWKYSTYVFRSEGSRDDQAGEAGPVEQSSAEAKSLKLRAKRLSGCHPSGQKQRQPDGRPEGQIKNYSHDSSLKETELKVALNGSTLGQKAARHRKEQLRKSLSCRRVWCRGWWGRWWMRTRRANHKSMWQRYGVWGLSPESES
jgi:hypothetical protein